MTARQAATRTAPLPRRAPPRPGLQRRQVLVLAGAALVGGPALAMDRQLRFATLTQAEQELQRLAQAKALDSQTEFSWAQTLVHCAQSIEFSLSGFPEPKSALFQQTVGAAAIHFFAWRGRMQHGLGEPIPGAATLQAEQDPVAALARLQKAMQAFRSHNGPLQPHFAYGALDKPLYEQAHAMHLAQHLSAFDVAQGPG